MSTDSNVRRPGGRKEEDGVEATFVRLPSSYVSIVDVGRVRARVPVQKSEQVRCIEANRLANFLPPLAVARLAVACAYRVQRTVEPRGGTIPPLLPEPPVTPKLGVVLRAGRVGFLHACNTPST